MMQLTENLPIRLALVGVGRDLAVFVGFARLASFFLLLSQKKETKEKATLSRLTLRCSASWAAIELTLTSHIKHGLLRSSNMRLPKAPMKLALLGAAEWDWMNVKSSERNSINNECAD